VFEFKFSSLASQDPAAFASWESKAKERQTAESRAERLRVEKERLVIVRAEARRDAQKRKTFCA